MPLTPFQGAVLGILARNRSEDSYLAGGSALHLAPDSIRFSKDLGFFHDSEGRVAAAFAADTELLRSEGFSVDVELSQPGHVRATVAREGASTRIDWAHDSAWRFLPPVRDPLGGYVLHDMDLAVNKVLALAGRDEPRDFVDILFVNRRILPLGALCWAAAGKDPGFTPHGLIELLKRRGRPRPEELARLHVSEPVDVGAAKQAWLQALREAEAFVDSRPADELGCLYYAPERETFVEPEPGVPLADQGIVPHFGRPGGVLPQPTGRSFSRDGD